MGGALIFMGVPLRFYMWDKFPLCYSVVCGYVN